MKIISNWKSFSFIVLGLLFVGGFFVLLTYPTTPARAADTAQGNVTDACSSCHKDVHERWSNSRHGQEATNCFVCHKLGEGEGAHPKVGYINLPEEETCDVCHADIKDEWLSSRHGERGMGCVTCHEPHSQQQKLIGENKSTCENCHRTQLEAAHNSTHSAVGLTCADCHLGPDVGHTFISQISTCQSCHSDIHEANSLVRGASITPISSDVKPRVVEAGAGTQRAGITLPTWLFFVVGIAIGAGAVWVLIERELDTSDKKAANGGNGDNGNGNGDKSK
jgi:hypothetical protein